MTGGALIPVQQHLAQGDLAAARAAMEGLDDAALLGCDFAPLAPVFQAAGFKYGESRIARLYQQRYPNNALLRLQGAEILIRLGLEDAALRELRDIAAMADVRRAIGRFWLLCKSLGRIDVAEALSERLAAEGVLTQQQNITFGFDLLDHYRATSQKGMVARQLIRLRDLCRGDSAAELRIVEASIGARLMDFATDVIETLKVPPEAEILLQLYRAQCLGLSNLPAAQKLIDELFAQPGGDCRFWIKVAQGVEPICGAATAIAAAERAMGCAATSQHRTQAGQRLAQLYLTTGKPDAAIRVLTAMLDLAEAATAAAYEFAHLARTAGDTGLALRFAERWHTAAPENPSAQLTHCQFLIAHGRRTQATEALRCFLEERRGDPLVARRVYVQFIRLAERVDFTLVQEACRQALTVYPGDTAFTSPLSADPFVDRFYTGAGVVTPARRGLLARLGIGRGRT